MSAFGTIELSIGERNRDGEIVEGKRHNVLFGRGQYAADFFKREALKGKTGQDRFNAELALFDGVD